MLDSYGTAGRVRIWMRMESGGVCWAISGCGTVVNEVFGIPATNIYQPGHEAYLLFSRNSNGNGIWEIWNNVGGWQSVYTRWGGRVDTEVRLLLGWGNKTYNNYNKNNASYILLAQNALDRYDSLMVSNIYNYLADCYTKTDDKIACYNKALSNLDTNLDSFDGLIDAYEEKGATYTEWYNLAKQISEKYAYYPLPMYEALTRIKAQVSTDNVAQIDLLINNALDKASKATDSDYIQSSACRAVASNLLNSSSTPLASFSFSGEDKNTIVINSAYDDYHFVVRYSLDGGNTFVNTESHKILLSQAELDSITATNDIKIGLVGTTDLFVIDILDGKTISTSIVTVDDEENILTGNASDLLNLEYSLDSGTTWQDYTSTTRIDGAKTIVARYKSYDRYLVGNSLTYTFGEDSSDDQHKYISSAYITCAGTSSYQSGEEGKNAIDPNPKVAFHTNYNIKDTAVEKYIVLKLDTARYISQIGYEAKNFNGMLKDATIYTSSDGETWQASGTISDWERSMTVKYATISPVLCQYIKIQATSTYGNSSANPVNQFFCARRIKLYEDVTID